MPKTVSPVDKHIGARVRAARLLKNMSQEKLGFACRLTFQQIQKYEKGTNRIGGSRMMQIAAALNQPAAYFFEGAPGAGNGTAHAAPDDNPLTALGLTREGIALARAFVVLPANVRHTITDMVKTLADGVSHQ